MNPSNRQVKIIGLALLAAAFLASLGATAFFVIRSFLGPSRQTVVLTELTANGVTPAPTQAPPPQLLGPVNVGGPVAPAPVPADAVTIGGIVHDENGNPIANVRVGVNIMIRGPMTRPPAAPGNIRTDDQGHWTFHGYNRDQLTNARVTFSQRDYVSQGLRAPSFDKLTAGDWVVVLSHGVDVQGVVVDAAGQPVSDAQVSLNGTRNPNNPPARTDTDGKFILHHVQPGASIAIFATHAGFAASVQQVQTSKQTAPVTIVMKPGRTITGHVTDKAGHAIAGANVNIQNVGGVFYGGANNSVTTNGSGEYTLRNAPADMVQISAYKQGYTSSNVQQVAADESTSNFTLSPQLSFSGTVTDAVTHQPIPQFTVSTGVDWQGNTQHTFSMGGSTFNNGSFTQPLTGYGGNIDAWYVRVQAKGYLPVISKPIHESGSQDFALQPGKDLTGHVLTSDGKPAAGVSIAMVPAGTSAYINDGQFQSQISETSTTDAQGNYDLPPETGNFEIVALGSGGWAQADQDAIAKSTDLTLAPWGRIEGTLSVNGKLASGEQINGNLADQIYDPGSPQVNFGMNAMTDAQGHFDIENVPAGDISLGRMVPVPGQNYSTTSNQQMVTVEPGKTTKIALGSTGRPVTGQVQMPPEAKNWHDFNIQVNAGMQTQTPLVYPMPADVQAKTPQEQQKWWHDFYKTDAGKAYRKAQSAIHNYYQQIGSDGKFTIDEVVPGQYTLSANIYPRSGGQPLAQGYIQFTMPPIPGGFSTDPLDVGQITVTPNKRLAIGDDVPEIAAKTLDGKDLKLADYRGKYVLLEFWRVELAGNPDQTQRMKDVFAALGTNDHLAIIGISISRNPEALKLYVAANGMGWTQGLIDLSTPSAMNWQQWGFQGIPDIFLIGPDGKLIARDLRGDGVLSAVQNALKNSP